MNNILKPKGYDDVQVSVDRPRIKPDGYVCQILKAKTETSKNGNILLVIYFDIAEGDFKGYYKQDYEEQVATPEKPKKWRGVYRIWLPNPDEYGTEKYEKATKNYKAFITSVERSNKGFAFNFQETSLAGKLVGFVFQEEEWEWEGRSGFTVKARFPRTVHSIRNGDFTVPKTKYLHPVTFGKPQTQPSDLPQFNWGNTTINEPHAQTDNDGLPTILTDINDDDSLPF